MEETAREMGGLGIGHLRHGSVARVIGIHD
jgi:hypothetical protein